MPSLRTRKRGKTWSYEFEIASIDGKRQRMYKGGFETKKAAIEAGTLAKNEYDQAGIIVKSTDISYHDYLNKWIEEYCIPNNKETTVESYRKKIRLYIDPALGKYRLQSLTPEVLNKFILDLFNTGMSRNSLISVKGILSSSLKYAVHPLMYLKSSPMDYVALPRATAIPKKQPKGKTRTVVSPEDFERIIERFGEDSTVYLPLQLGYRCGLRLGEVFGLTENDFDSIARTLTVQRQVQSGTNNTWIISKPKYGSSRVIQLDDVMYDILFKHIQRIHQDQSAYAELYQRYQLGENDEIIDYAGGTEFKPLTRRHDGSYCTPRITQHLGRVVHYDLNMPKWDFHSLRHTHTTNLLTAGCDIKFVQERLGHKNIETTLNIYTHLSDGMVEKNVDILNNI